MLIGVKLRGEEYDVEVTDRRDYDDPEWSRFGMTGDDIAALNVTTREEDEITAQVSQTLYDRAANWCPEDDE